MSATFKELGTVKVVTDHDCGNYFIGEADGGFNPDLLTEHLLQHGDRGYKELAAHLSYMQFQLVESWRKVTQSKAPKAQCERIKI